MVGHTSQIPQKQKTPFALGFGSAAVLELAGLSCPQIHHPGGRSDEDPLLCVPAFQQVCPFDSCCNMFPGECRVKPTLTADSWPGTRTVNVLPSPTSLSTPIVPPSSSANFFVMLCSMREIAATNSIADLFGKNVVSPAELTPTLNVTFIDGSVEELYDLIVAELCQRAHFPVGDLTLSLQMAQGSP